MKEIKKEIGVGSNESQIHEICIYFKEYFQNINQVGNFLNYKIGEKILFSLSSIFKKFADQNIRLDIDLIRAEFSANTYLNKLVWNEETLLNKYGHLIYSQNIRTISSQFKKLLINKFGAVEVKIENITRTNVTKLLNGILDQIKKIVELTTPPHFFAGIEELVLDYAKKYNLVLKK